MNDATQPIGRGAVNQYNNPILRSGVSLMFNRNILRNITKQ